MSHEFNPIVDVGKGGKNVDKGISWNDWVACFVELGKRVLMKDVVELLFNISYRLTITTVGLLKGELSGESLSATWSETSLAMNFSQPSSWTETEIEEGPNIKRKTPPNHT